jgi:Uma2 family endonuclease
MSLAPPNPIATIADLLARLGDVAPGRVLLEPTPGTASENDVIAAERGSNRLFELVDGVLVEKTMGFRESIVALALAGLLRQFVLSHNLGVVSGPDGMIRLGSSLVRIPDVAFVSWQRMPGGRIPNESIAPVIPDLVIEIVSRSNTAGELDRKRREYLAAGVQEIWEIDIDARQALVHAPASATKTISGNDLLEGSGLLIGFSVSLPQLLLELDRRP